ncbi:T9SS type A sorting domain-containing protein [Spirosoma flavum]|uniref:T9SS type A sorting domain-containing protein n=1 Tax=Spirosoma flavum TaxID=2048557 RepID=A0ABW6AR40_9BACT
MKTISCIAVAVLLLVCTVSVEAQSKLKLALHYPLSGTGNQLFNEVISNYNAVSASGVTSTDGIYRQPNTAAAFSQGISQLLFRDDLKTYLNPNGAGYSITCWVYTQPYTEGLQGRTPQSTDDRKQIFFAANSDKTNLFGLKVIKDNLMVDRYTDQVYPVKNWEFWLWRPNLFSAQGGWHMLLISVQNSFMKYKVYKPGDTGNTGSCCNCELSYVSGQDLSSAVYFGLGNNILTTTAVQKIDEFKVYSGSMNFSQMDSLYTKEKPPVAGRLAATDLSATQDSSEVIMTVYPNPVSDNLFIAVRGASPSEGVFTLYNTQGQVAYRRTVRLQIEKQVYEFTDLRSKGLKSGLYTLILSTDKTKKTAKVLIQ